MRLNAALGGQGNLGIRTNLLRWCLCFFGFPASGLFFSTCLTPRSCPPRFRPYRDVLSTPTEIAKSQPGAERRALTAYAEKLTQLGVKDVSIADAEEQVQASTNPKVVGKPLLRASKKKGPREYVIRGVLGEETGPPGSQKTSTLTIPIVVADRRV